MIESKTLADKRILEKNMLQRMVRRIFFYLGSISHRKIEVDRRRALEDAIRTFQTEYEKADSFNHKEHKTIFNIGLYLLIVEYDVSAFKFLIFNEIDDWPKKLVARKFVILMYEASQDLPELLGKKGLRPIVSGFGNPDLLRELDGYRQMIKEFNNSYGKTLSDIRNNCSAHRDLIACKQLDVIEELDIHWLQQEVGAAFMKIVREVNISLMRNVLQEMVQIYQKEVVELIGVER